MQLTLSDGTTVDADHVVVAVGVEVQRLVSLIRVFIGCALKVPAGMNARSFNACCCHSPGWLLKKRRLCGC